MTGTSDIIHQGMLRAPRVLIVDDDGGQLDLLCERANRTTPPSLFGCEPVFVAYGPQRYPLREGVVHCNTLGQVASIALDPANRIEAVVSDLYEGPEQAMDAAYLLDPPPLEMDDGAFFSSDPYAGIYDDATIYARSVPYGLTLLNILKQNGFGGPMALQSAGHSRDFPDEHRRIARMLGAIGLFEQAGGPSTNPSLSAFAAVRQALCAARGETNGRDAG